MAGVLLWVRCITLEDLPGFLLFTLHTTFSLHYDDVERVFRNSDDAGKLNNFFLLRSSRVLWRNFRLYIFRIVAEQVARIS